MPTYLGPGGSRCPFPSSSSLKSQIIGGLEPAPSTRQCGHCPSGRAIRFPRAIPSPVQLDFSSARHHGPSPPSQRLVFPAARRRGAPGAPALQSLPPQATTHATVHSGAVPAYEHHLYRGSPQLGPTDPPGPSGGRAAQLGLASRRSHATALRGRGLSRLDFKVPLRPNL
ncbi:hypothetical protein NDU88_002038 [Pleurodeles waltl]|uniref:Uncharacterized protein n=1 Tax=Pleurodeles waltl TaxID=8319 RepID=A0AAV7NF77_PLEWA|nr:hypothetical protein NDU88_002038 [Pleurodeles waltl]